MDLKLKQMVPQKTILRKVENQVKQQLIGGLMLVAAGLMILNTFVGFPGWVRADNTDLTNLTFNITAGTFSIDNAPAAMAFASQGFGTANNILGNEEIDNLAVTDYRGNSQAWTVAVNANNFVSGGDQISSAALNCFAENGAITNVENGDTNQVAKGANGTLDSTGITLLNGSIAASGIFRYDNGVVRLTVNGAEAAGTYGAIMVYTLT